MQGGSKFRDTWEALKDVLDDFNMVFSPGGMHINSLDVNNVALVNATFWAQKFERYSCVKTYVCGLNMATLYKTFKVISKSTKLTLRIDEDYPSVLYVCMVNESTGVKFEVTLKMWGHDKKMLKIRDSVFDRHVTMPSAEFQSIIGYISAFHATDDENKVLNVELHPDALVLSSQGQFGLSRVSINQTNTGMAVNSGTIDALQDNLDDQNETSDDGFESNDDDEGLSSSEKSEKRQKTANGQRRVIKRPTSSSSSDDVSQASQAIVKNPYNLKYMRYITKATPLSPTVRLFMRANFPIIVSFNIGVRGVLHYCLGPVATENDSDSENSFDDADN